jgi:integrase
VRTIAVESWLRQLQRKDGEALANSSKAKIRNVMSVLFNHAIRYEWLEQGKNPIQLVRQSTLRQRSPTVLEPHELQNLLSQPESPYRLMMLLAVTTGLRRSEPFALKWSDLDFTNLTIGIKRSIFQGIVGSCKTAASRTSIPLPLFVAAELWMWKETTRYARPDDWIFAGPHPREGSRSILTW